MRARLAPRYFAAMSSRGPHECPPPAPSHGRGNFYFTPFTGGYTSFTPGCILVAPSGLFSYMQIAATFTLGCILVALSGLLSYMQMATALTLGCVLAALSGLLSYMQMATALTLGCILAAPVYCALRARAHLQGFCTLTRAHPRTSTTTRTSRTREKREKRRATISAFWSSLFPTAAHSVLLQGVYAMRKAR